VFARKPAGTAGGGGGERTLIRTGLQTEKESYQGIACQRQNQGQLHKTECMRDYDVPKLAWLNYKLFCEQRV